MILSSFSISYICIVELNVEIRSSESFPFVLHLSHIFSKSLFKDLVDILSVTGRTREILISLFLSISYGFSLLDLLGPAVIFIAHEDDHRVL